MAIFVAGRRGRLKTWLNARPFLYLGKISYSLYLVHVIVGGRVMNLGARLTPDSSLAAWGWFAVAFVASIVAADLLYRVAEVTCPHRLVSSA